MRKDEKNAFDAMMEEIDDSDEEEYSKPQIKPIANSRASLKSESKPYDNNSYSSGAKPSQSSAAPRRSVMSKEEQEIANFGSNYTQSPADLQSEQINTTKRWLMRPCSKDDKNSMKCFVERERHTFGMQTIYRCYLENLDGQTGRFMMSAKKKASKQTSYYLITLDENPSDDRGSETVLGKVRGNAIGSLYLICDSGLAPEKTVVPSMLRKELGVVGFEFDSGGPSRMESWIPSVTPSGLATVWQPDSEANGMEAKITEKNLDKIFRLKNKIPKWDDAHGGHVLNFHGRVTESSVKNFQLCCVDIDDQEEVVLQFGRVGKNKFTMDLRFPLSPLQAFGICVACLDGKIADRKGFEYIKRLTGSGVPGKDPEDDDENNADSKIDGNMKGSSSISGMFRESLPSGQYLRDKLYRTFK